MPDVEKSCIFKNGKKPRIGNGFDKGKDGKKKAFKNIPRERRWKNGKN